MLEIPLHTLYLLPLFYLIFRLCRYGRDYSEAHARRRREIRRSARMAQTVERVAERKAA
jgi:hypothetical protein